MEKKSLKSASKEVVRPPAPPPPPTSRRLFNGTHLFNGICVYCGEEPPSSDVHHLKSCRSYSGQVRTSGSFGASTIAENKRSHVRVEDHNLSSPSRANKTRKKEEGAQSAFVSTQDYQWPCLCCQEEDCSYEQDARTAIANIKEGAEYDPNQPRLCQKGLIMPKRLWELIRDHLVDDFVASQWFFAHHKYIGSVSLDAKIKIWLQMKLRMEQFVENHWLELRLVVKETMRLRRILVVEDFQQAFQCECPIDVACLLGVCFLTSLLVLARLRAGAGAK